MELKYVCKSTIVHVHVIRDLKWRNSDDVKLRHEFYVICMQLEAVEKNDISSLIPAEIRTTVYFTYEHKLNLWVA